MVKENCGVVGIYSLDGVNVIPMLIDSLRALQHRGQEAWGIAIPNKEPLKKIGLVSASATDFKRISQSIHHHQQLAMYDILRLEKVT